MTDALSVLSALGGFAVFTAAVVAVVRAIFRQINATDKNTEALGTILRKIENLERQAGDHAQRIARLEGRG